MGVRAARSNSTRQAAHRCGACAPCLCRSRHQLQQPVFVVHGPTHETHHLHAAVAIFTQHRFSAAPQQVKLPTTRPVRRCQRVSHAALINKRPHRP